MIEPYFAAWIEARKRQAKKDSYIDDLREAWNHANGIERSVFATFVVSDIALILFGFAAFVDSRLLPACAAFFVLFLVLAVVTDRVITLRDRRIPEWKLEGKAELVEDVRCALKRLGLVRSEQVRLVRDEAVRLLDHKEHRHEMIVHGALEVVVLAALVCVFNFLIAGLDHNLSFAVAMVIAGVAIAASVVLLLSVHIVWLAFDRFGAFPVALLRRFIDDLSFLLVEEARTPAPPLPRRPHRNRRR